MEGGAATTAGVFRIAGLHDGVTALAAVVEARETAATVIHALHDADIYVLTSLMKRYLSHLPDAVVPTEAYGLVAAVAAADAGLDRDLAIADLLEACPSPHRATLVYLLSELSGLAAAAEVTQMTADNLAIVFAPTLFRSPAVDPMQALAAAREGIEALRALLAEDVAVLAESVADLETGYEGAASAGVGLPRSDGPNGGGDGGDDDDEGGDFVGDDNFAGLTVVSPPLPKSGTAMVVVAHREVPVPDPSWIEVWAFCR